jgi:TolA-binding protein
MLTLAAGCGDPPDKRLLDLAQQSLAQQARQSEQLAQQSRQVTEAARQLVAADAQARQELVAGMTQLQQRIQTQRGEFDRQRDTLERERRELAAQRGRDPIIAQAIGAIGVTVACLLPLLLAGYVLYTVNRASPEDDAQAVSDVLIGEMVSSAPELLPGPAATPQLELKQAED